uniref:Uncharacterized protein n=1 Tax=Pavo cristatus TaxID=9049 RepID=A0A8C9G440_PAVCR
MDKLKRVLSGRDAEEPGALAEVIDATSLGWGTRVKGFIACFALGCVFSVLGRQPLDQAAQSHIQPGLECLQGWGIHSLFGQPVPVCHHPLCVIVLFLLKRTAPP